MLRPGDTAPEFALADQTGATTTLDTLVASGPLVLFFYPADFTPVCTREACLFRDGYAELAAAGIEVAGVSPNDVDSHARFEARHVLPYRLLADPDRSAARAYGVIGPLGIGIRRATFLISTDRRILDAVRADLRLGPHERLMKRALAARSA